MAVSICRPWSQPKPFADDISAAAKNTKQWQVPRLKMGNALYATNCLIQTHKRQKLRTIRRQTASFPFWGWLEPIAAG